MRYRLVLLITGIAALAACNKSPQVNEQNASVAEVAQKVREAGADSMFVNPGKWQSKVTIEQFEVPGMPPQMAQRMKETMAKFQERSFETCLTKEDAKRPKEDFFTGKNSACRYDHFTMGDGKIDALMRCGGGEGGAVQVMSMTGTYSPEAYAMRMAMTREGGPKPSAGTTMKMRVESHRIGECTGDEVNVAARGGRK
jgi:hypothetical protein